MTPRFNPQRRPLPDALFAYLEPIFNETCAAHAGLAVAVSGGADSMALALLARHWCDRHGVALSALTVDHGLRAESAQEAAQVAGWMQAWGIRHHILAPQADASIRNLQSRARDMRYRALTGWCRAQDAALLVAHHADDQAETVALQKHRSESPPSRAGMALVSERDGVALIRPLLGVRKQALMDCLHAHGQHWIDDPSNASDAYARNRLRQQLDEAAIIALWQEAQAHGQQRHRDDAARRAWMLQHADISAADVALNHAAWCRLGAAMRSDVLSRAVQAVGGKAFRPRQAETQRLTNALMTEPHGRATLGHCLIDWNGRRILIRPEPHGLDNGGASPHMKGANPLKQLASEPFWWFNYALFS